MTTQLSPLVAAFRPRRGGSSCLLLALSLSVVLGMTTVALAADASAGASGATKVYTNADLAKYATESDAVVTNKHLKAPIPSQSAPIAGSDGDWNFVLAMLDREHEKTARSREEALAMAAAIAAENEYQEPAPVYAYPWFLNNGNPFVRRDHRNRKDFRDPVPINTNRPLDERGIDNPRQLFNEAQLNGFIQRSDIFHPGFPYALVPPAKVTPHAGPVRGGPVRGGASGGGAAGGGAAGVGSGIGMAGGGR